MALSAAELHTSGKEDTLIAGASTTAGLAHRAEVTELTLAKQTAECGSFQHLEVAPGNYSWPR